MRENTQLQKGSYLWALVRRYLTSKHSCGFCSVCRSFSTHSPSKQGQVSTAEEAQHSNGNAINLCFPPFQAAKNHTFARCVAGSPKITFRAYQRSLSTQKIPSDVI
jgi:hypothetical protein